MGRHLRLVLGDNNANQMDFIADTFHGLIQLCAGSSSG